MSVSVDKALRAAKAAEKRGDSASAEQCYRDILARFPQNIRAHAGLQHLTRQNVQAAEPSHEALLQLTSLYKQGKIEAALSLIIELNEQYKNSATLANMTGVLHAELGDFEEAVVQYKKVLAVAPNNAEVHGNLGAALGRLGRRDEAIGHLETAVRLKPNWAEGYNNLANAYSAQHEPDKAIVAYRKAIELNPNYVQAYKNLGVAFNVAGEREKAIELYLKALDIKPDYGECHYNLGLAKTFKGADPQVENLEALIAAGSRPDKELMYYNFALGKAYEDLGNTDRAFEHYAEGNRLRQKELQYEFAADRKLFGKIRALFDSNSVLSLKNVEDPKLRPIFIVGLPRSGTTLVEQILSSHSEVYGAGELEIFNRIMQSDAKQIMSGQAPAFDQSRMNEIRQRYYEGLTEQHATECVVTDKMPLNFRWIGFILNALPEAKIVHATRDPVAVGWSIFKQCFSGQGNSFSYDLTDIARFTQLYENLMSFWHSQFPNRIHDLQYEVLIRNQERETRSLLEYCGLSWEEQCLNFHETERAVLTASTLQVRQKMYTGSSEAWKPFEDHLTPLIKGLQPTSAAE